MQTSGFSNTPISQCLFYFIVISSIAASVLDIKYLFHIQIIPHLWKWRQWWRLLIWQTMYANAGEVLFGTLAVYNLRVIERLWGSRKFASFLTYNFVATSIIAPLLLAALLRPVSFWRMNYLPPGPTSLIFSILAQYHAAIPHIYKFRIAAPRLSAPPPAQTPAAAVAAEEAEVAFTLSDKIYVYIVAIQLAFCQPPGSLLAAAVGWICGYAWRAELVPWGRWRYPVWLFEKARERTSNATNYEGLRRVARGEESAAGLQQQQQQQQGDGAPTEGQGSRNQPLGNQILEQLRGGF